MLCSRSSMAPSSHYNIFAPRYLELKEPKPGLQPRVPRPRRGSSRRQRVPVAGPHSSANSASIMSPDNGDQLRIFFSLYCVLAIKFVCRSTISS